MGKKVGVIEKVIHRVIEKVGVIEKVIYRVIEKVGLIEKVVNLAQLTSQDM